MPSPPGRMPPQLARAYKPRKSSRPIAEKLPRINISDIKIPTDSRSYTLPNIAFKYPFLAAARLTRDAIEFHFPSLHRSQLGRTQTFQIYPVRVGYGIRYYFRCDCRRGAMKLYLCNAYLACKHSHHVRMACQAATPRPRPILLAAKLQSIIENAPLYKRTREHLIRRFGEKVLMAQRLLK